jgi:hypothetical protein
LRKVIYILIIFSVIVESCSVYRKSRETTSRTEKEVTSDRSIESVIRNNLSNSDFYIQKADINVIQDGISVRFTAGIKFKRPDSLLIFARSRTGIEAGRAFITKDTVIINDRINRKVLIGKPAVIGAKYGIDPSLIFVVLGDMIVEEKDRVRPMECAKGIFTNEFEVHDKKVEYTIDCDRKKTKQAYFEGDIKTGNITIGLSDIIESEMVRFPRRIEISDDLKSLNIIVEIKKIESPWTGKIGFVPGAGYKVVKIR